MHGPLLHSLYKFVWFSLFPEAKNSNAQESTASTAGHPKRRSYRGSWGLGAFRCFPMFLAFVQK